MNTKAQKIARLQKKQYRDAFVGSQISVGLPFQIRALREQRDWKQSRLASECGMLQPRISAMESPGGAKFNLETLRRLASAFDVALVVRFVPFGELVDWSERFNPDTFKIPSFKDDPALKEESALESLGQRVVNLQGQVFDPPPSSVGNQAALRIVAQRPAPAPEENDVVVGYRNNRKPKSAQTKGKHGRAQRKKPGTSTARVGITEGKGIVGGISALAALTAYPISAR